MQENYEQYINEWLEGIQSEILFWKEYMEEKGGIYKNGFVTTTQKNRKFVWENEITEEKQGEIFKFADIGSGPFSNCGIESTKVRLEAVAVDPLAEVYKKLKKQYDLENGIELRIGFVECLDTQFREDEFDMVHMSNALDHCFDPIIGIYQMLYICKVGGKVILRHMENEGEREGYQGLHQWNLSLKNSEKSFLIWRKDQRFDVVNIFKDFADIRLYPGDGEWPYNKVVLTKRESVKIPKNCYFNILFYKEHEYFTNQVLKLVFSDNKRIEMRAAVTKMLERLDKNPQKFQKKLENLDINTVVIYGMGMHGQMLFALLKRLGIQVCNIIDVRKMMIEGIRSVSLEEYNDIEDSSAIVICVPGQIEVLREKLISKNIESEKIFGIEEFLHV